MDKEQARKEAEKIFDEYSKKAIEIEQEAKKKGSWKMGLDSNKSLFAEITRERNEKLKLLASMVDKE